MKTETPLSQLDTHTQS